MIAECANDLYTKVQALPALAASVGLAVGGMIPDPGMTKTPLPAAWVLAHTGESNNKDGDALPLTITHPTLSFLVMLYVPYVSQQDLITNQLPLLSSVGNAIQGTLAPTGNRWRWKRFDLSVVNTDRLGYRLIFLVDSATL